MYSLIVDSSTKRLYVCIVGDNKVLFERYVEGRNDHAKNIVSTIDEGLRQAGITIDMVDEAICGVGPGSYTGVRMGVTVLKMLSVFKGVDLYSISTLKLMASGTKSDSVLAFIDARRSNSFACILNTNTNEYILPDGYYSNEMLDGIDKCVTVGEDDFVVDPIYVVTNKERVSEPHLLVPNYLRDTEAERNLK